MQYKTQAEFEEVMFVGGVARATKMMANAEGGGRATTNPYAREILSDFVLPLSKAIGIELDDTRPGRRRAHAQLLAGLDTDAVAFLAVRTVVNACLQGGDVPLRAIGNAIGRTIHSELVLSQIEADSPELYHTLSRDLSRRMSRDERHRLNVFRTQAAKNGIELVEWPIGARHQVGLYLLGLLEGAGLVEIEPLRMERSTYMPQLVTLHSDLMERIAEVKSFVSISMPVYGPCVEPPLDWTDHNDGGFHTRAMRRAHNTLVRHPLARSSLYSGRLGPRVLDGVNALQRTAWAVNGRMLTVMRELAKGAGAGEVTTLQDIPKPEQPGWLSEEWTANDRGTWPEGKLEEFTKWKRRVADWHTERKIRATKYSRFYTTTRMADMYLGYPAIYFVYFADSRGRLYPMTTGINPQGSDMQKALLHFAKGLPLDSPDAIRWFHVQGANKWGFDKATLEDRHKWVIERQEQILAFADDPLVNLGWRDAGDPFQFLAWCFEYHAWYHDQDGSFVSRIPVSMDGSCNGLQNLSALLRDEVGGAATNLVPAEKMEDIYRRVAEAATVRMQGMQYEDEKKERARRMWLAHGINRGCVKRSVMTTPYGVTKRSAIDYVIDDTLRKGEGPAFEKSEYFVAAQVLMDSAWPAIGDIVVKGVECMAWLKKCSGVILRTLPEGEEPIIQWMSPSGFPAAQAYYEEEVHRINTHISGGMKIRVNTETDLPSKGRHSNGMAPNFVHSLDAAHLHLTASAARSAGIDALAMIHDDYGTHAANSQKLYEIIREQFVLMYEGSNPLEEFRSKYPAIPEPPTPGSLVIRDVLSSRFFFS